MREDRIGNIEHLRNEIWRSGNLQIGDKTVTAAQVIETLAPRLTAERLARIDSVVKNRTYAVATVTEHLFDVGNISAVMRSAESYGFLPFHIIERPDARYKKSDRISKGTEKWLDIHRTNSSVDTVHNLQSDGYKVYATSLEATVDWDDIDFTAKTAVVLGNEKEGISREMQKSADGLFKIPMYGFAQSFNISVAAAILFSHIHNIRLKRIGRSGDLTSDEQMYVRASYYLRSCDNPEIYFR